jgi:anti-anti-sigma factor
VVGGLSTVRDFSLNFVSEISAAMHDPVSAAMHDPERVESSATESTRFACEVVPERDAVRVRPVGALDMATAPALHAEIAQLRDAGFRCILVDLRELEFMDSSGLRALLTLNAQANSDGFELGLVRGNPTVDRVFEVTGTKNLLPFTDS